MEHSFMAADKREREKRIGAPMISLYCRKKRPPLKGRLCPECEALLSYAHLRSDRCPFMETKTFCSNCQVHCYKPEMREKIREVMRFAGPRMLPRHPLMVIDHIKCPSGKRKNNRKGKDTMIKTRLMKLLKGSERYIAQNVLWQWLALG